MRCTETNAPFHSVRSLLLNIHVAAQKEYIGNRYLVQRDGIIPYDVGDANR